jgi:hypothetical protein
VIITKEGGDPNRLTKRAVPDWAQTWEDEVGEILFWPEENLIRLKQWDHIRDADRRHKPRLENLEH